MSAQLHDRWLEFVQAVEKECWAHGQHPGGGVLEANESLLKVSLLANGDERISSTFREQEILGGDLKALASEFHANYRAERDQA